MTKQAGFERISNLATCIINYLSHGRALDFLGSLFDPCFKVATLHSLLVGEQSECWCNQNMLGVHARILYIPHVGTISTPNLSCKVLGYHGPCHFGCTVAWVLSALVLERSGCRCLEIEVVQQTPTSWNMDVGVPLKGPLRDIGPCWNMDVGSFVLVVLLGFVLGLDLGLVDGHMSYCSFGASTFDCGGKRVSEDQAYTHSRRVMMPSTKPTNISSLQVVQLSWRSTETLTCCSPTTPYPSRCKNGFGALKNELLGWRLLRSTLLGVALFTSTSSSTCSSCPQCLKHLQLRL